MRDFFGSRHYLVVLVESALIVITYLVAAMLVSFRLQVPAIFIRTIPLVLVIKLAIFYEFGLFRGWWCYVGMNDALDITRASTFSSILMLSIMVPLSTLPAHTIAVLFVDLVLTIAGLAGGRFAVRAYTEAAMTKLHAHRKTIIVGAASTGNELARELLHHPDLDYNPVGFVDDDPTKRGLRINGVEVLGSTGNLEEIIRRHEIETVMIAIRLASGDLVRRILDICSKCKVEFKIVPTLAERLNGSSFTLLRNVAMEDLLGREPVRLEVENITAKIQNKVTLITGAAGSIGSELVRQAARFSPRKLILFDRSENDLFKLSNELKNHFPTLRFASCIGDVADVRTLRDVFARERVNLVFHAAAYKHVPMMETNCFQAVTNNIYGSCNVALVSREHEVEDFIMISTDKAVNPTSVMGVTKRVAELAVLALQNGSTLFSAVRFGNVLGSNGSVVPIFRQQIAEGGPVTVTHPDAVRYFMTIPEAVQLVLQASAMGRGGEIFVLDMGKPVSVLELARNMIRLAGITHGRNIEIVFTGLRPGEKLFEELRLDDENLRQTSHEQIRVLNSVLPDIRQVNVWLDDLSAILAARNVNALVQKLKEIVPTYTPSKELLAMCEIDRYDQSWKYIAERAKESTAVA